MGRMRCAPFAESFSQHSGMWHVYIVHLSFPLLRWEIRPSYEPKHLN